MPKQVLAILEADASRPETATESMLQVMNPDLGKSSSSPSRTPSAPVHASHGRTLVGENVLRVGASALINYRSCNTVENDQSLFAVLHFAARNDEILCPEFRYIDLPFPSQIAPERHPVFTANKAISVKWLGSSRKRRVCSSQFNG